MKYLRFVSLFALVSFAQAQEIETVPQLQKATVYLNAAKLFYAGQAELPAGNVKLVFKGLSPYLIQESMVLKGVGNVEIIHFQYRNDYLVNERDNQKIRELEKKLLEVSRKNNLIDAEILALKDELTILKGNAKLDKPNLTAVQQYLNYYKKRVKEVRKQLFELEQKQKPLLKEIDKLEKQLKELKGKSRRKAKDLIVSLYVPKAQKFHYRLEYLTRNARWQPSYRLKAGKDKTAVDWTYQAEVTQETGIDWENVSVTLSNLRPQFHMRIPQPQPWYLYPHGQNVYKSRAKGMVLMEASGAPDNEVSYAETEITESDIDVEYTMKNTYDILSGNEPLLITLQQFTTPAEFGYYTVPYLSRNAYLMATVKDLEQYRLLPGKARLYYMDRYTGETRINPQTAEEGLKLSFGIDPEIAVKRKTTKNFRDYKSMSNKVVVQREYTIEIKNNKKIPVDITVKDRVPVSQDEKIEVKNVHIENGGIKDKNGIITWKIRLNPGEKKTLKFYFEVKFPKDYGVYF